MKPMLFLLYSMFSMCLIQLKHLNKKLEALIFDTYYELNCYYYYRFVSISFKISQSKKTAIMPACHFSNSLEGLHVNDYLSS